MFLHDFISPQNRYLLSFLSENGTVVPKIDSILNKFFSLSDAVDDYKKENDIAGGSIIKFIRYLVECKGGVIATEGAMILLKAATVLGGR